MSKEELRSVAMECLARAFKGEGGVPVHVVQAATTIVVHLTDAPTQE